MVPYEIIARIFADCLPGDGRVKPLPHAAPLLLAQICSQWRQIALETRELWSSFDFTFRSHALEVDRRAFRTYLTEFPDPLSYDGISTLLETWLPRAHGHPLSITLRCTRGRRAIPQRIVLAISRFSRQLERLEVAIPYDNRNMLRQLSGGPLPKLLTLSFAFPIGHLPMPDIPSAAQLTSLDFGWSMKTRYCPALFDRFPTLRHLKLGTFHVNDIAFPVPPIIYPSLQSLTLIHDDGDLLTALTLPHLRTLHYSISTPTDFNILRSFLSRSACVLCDLTLRVTAVLEDAALIEFLHVVPSLEELRLDCKSGNSPTLYRDLQHPTLLPNLRALFIFEAQNRYNYVPVATMLRARRSAAPPGKLAIFELHLDGARPETNAADPPISRGSAFEEFERLIEGGLHVRVHGPEVEWPVARQNDDVLEFPLCEPPASGTKA
ncbi:hypothetical protein DFH09DRAFT_1363622 [Mycena vulgaris]|nr:hypothetical protein DFH09DRAFT_1363622 [Mycena vulgaris]